MLFCALQNTFAEREKAEFDPTVFHTQDLKVDFPAKGMQERRAGDQGKISFF